MLYTASIRRSARECFPVSGGEADTGAGDGCITRIPEVLKTHGIKAVQIITTPGTIRRGTIAPLLAQCEDAGIRTVLYTEVSPDPTVAEVEAAAECFCIRL